VLRASGVPYDIRRADPYSIYDRFDFDVAVRYHGDIYDRYLIRMDEMRQSLRILQQAIAICPEGHPGRQAPVPGARPAGESYGRVKARKASWALCGLEWQAQPWRYHVRAPSFINLTALETMSVGNKIADVVAILGSIDIVLGETDR
jgi:NADH-quinone oxidoreductase subunit C/D